MMGIMAQERGGQIFATDERFTQSVFFTLASSLQVHHLDSASTMGS
jgi:hypothetical protein